jgi:class 3 adenylate cyclase/pimeloyl-ACP methyl ester carboxylesterase
MRLSAGATRGALEMVMNEFPCVRYADAEGVSIAYEVRGDGPTDLVRVSGSISSLVGAYLDPVAQAHYERLAAFSRLISLDRRGTGLSGPLVAGEVPPLEQRVADVIAVMDTVGCEHATLYGLSIEGGQVAVLCTAMYPHRVDALVLSHAWARVFRSDDYPIGLPPELAEPYRQSILSRWGDIDEPWGIEIVPSRRAEPGFPALLARVEQVSASPEVAAALELQSSDVRDVLSLVQAPTLVMYPAENSLVAQQAHFLADHIPNAKLASYPGSDTYFGTDTPVRTEIIEEFVTGTRPVPVSDRVLATVVFTDIVGSTERLAEVGDHRWRELLDHHDAMVRRQLVVFRGQEVDTAGDGFFATFDGPARAIGCAQAIIRDASDLGIDIRVGVHTGECEVRGNDLSGIAVHVGARVAALAGPGEIYTSSTVKDLVAGSTIAFAEIGLRDLKGVPEPKFIYRVVL